MESKMVKTESDSIDLDDVELDHVETDAIEDANVTRLPVDHARDEGADGVQKPDYLRDVSDNSDGDGALLATELRDTRKKLGEDVQTIATALNIRAAHLEALERGDISALPGRAYALGFVRSYASYLGMDAEASVARFKLETDRQEEEAAAIAFPEANDEVRMPQGSFLVVAFLLVAAILGGLQLSRMVDSMLTTNSVPPPELAETTSAETTEAPVAGLLESGGPASGVPAVGAPDSASAVASEAGNVDVAGMVEPEGTPLAADAVATEVEPVVEESVTPTPVVEATATPAAIVADEQSFGADPSKSRVSIFANGDAWLRVDNPTSGAVLIQTTMRAGDRFFVPNDEGLVMAARNSNNLEIFVDGRSIGPAGAGVVVEKTLDADLLISPAD